MCLCGDEPKSLCLWLIVLYVDQSVGTGFFSRQDTKTPVRIAIWAMVANMAFNLLLIGPFDHVGLAMATALSATVKCRLVVSWVAA